MREIKFRAWDTRLRKWLPQDSFSISGDGTINLNYCSFIVDNLVQRTDLVLIQSTGLHDNNGNEIYEGDVVKYLALGDTHIRHVGFAEGSFTLENPKPMTFTGVGERLTHRKICELQPTTDTLEVIGNIYENSDLLK